MVKAVFYEKPGCINNAKQRALLYAAGHELDVRSLLKVVWTVEGLRPFFGDLPVVEWFNYTAPRIKSGEVNPLELDEETALKLMMEDPLLIRRPLIKVGEVCRVGFDPEKIDDWIGLSPVPSSIGDVETCPRSHEKTPCATKN
jgi:nitrogenase-associated protein